MAVLETAPRLPAGPVDFNALHDAIKKGATEEEALIACGAKEAPEAAPAEAAEPAPAAAGKK